MFNYLVGLTNNDYLSTLGLQIPGLGSRNFQCPTL